MSGAPAGQPDPALYVTPSYCAYYYKPGKKCDNSDIKGKEGRKTPKGQSNS